MQTVLAADDCRKKKSKYKRKKKKKALPKPKDLKNKPCVARNGEDPIVLEAHGIYFSL